jgi:hypothetical protein
MRSTATTLAITGIYMRKPTVNGRDDKHPQWAGKSKYEI